MNRGDNGWVPSSDFARSGGGYHSHYLSGWCGRCGRKRGADNRCGDCDGWWTSPVLVLGGPLIAGVSALLLIGLPLLRPHQTALVLAAAAIPTATPRMYHSPVPQMAPPARPSVASFASLPAPPPLPPNPASDALREQANLLRLTQYTEAVVRADEQRREASDWQQRHQAAISAPVYFSRLDRMRDLPPASLPQRGMNATADAGLL